MTRISLISDNVSVDCDKTVCAQLNREVQREVDVSDVIEPQLLQPWVDFLSLKGHCTIEWKDFGAFLLIFQKLGGSDTIEQLLFQVVADFENHQFNVDWIEMIQHFDPSLESIQSRLCQQLLHHLYQSSCGLRLDQLAQFLRLCVRHDTPSTDVVLPLQSVIQCVAIHLDHLFMPLRYSKHLMELDAQSFASYMRRDSLSAPSEDIIVQTILDWLEYDPRRRKQNLETVVLHDDIVRWQFVSSNLRETVRGKYRDPEAASSMNPAEAQPGRSGLWKPQIMYRDHTYRITIAELRNRTFEYALPLRKKKGSALAFQDGVVYEFGGEQGKSVLNSIGMLNLANVKQITSMTRLSLVLGELCRRPHVQRKCELFSCKAFDLICDM